MHDYKRLSSLNICPAVTSFYDLKEGDCIIAFSRKTCHLLKRSIENIFPGSCSIVYGNLPPDTRREQARKFNEDKSVKFLIATDAIGMGLNFQINRIIFYDTEKFDGSNNRNLYPHEVKQIAGRAGRNEENG